MAPLSLRELQQRLRELISAPDTWTADASTLERRMADLGIRGDERLSAADRVRVYAGMYTLRLRDALAKDYPALHRALGDAAFDELARRTKPGR
jgi:hypothetical protein